MKPPSITQEAKFLRLVPSLLRERRAIQIGDPTKRTAKTARRRRTWYFGILNSAWGIGSLTFFLGIFIIFFSGDTDSGLILSAIGVGACVIGLLNYFDIPGGRFVPARWIVVRRGLFVCTAKDDHRFIPWESVGRIETKYHSYDSRIRLTTSDGLLTMSGKSWDLLAFVNKMLMLVPESIDRSALLTLRKELRCERLYNHLFQLVELFQCVGLMLCIPPLMYLSRTLRVNETDFVIWMGTIIAAVLIVFGIYFWIQSVLKRRRLVQVGPLLDRLDREDFSEELAADRSPRHDLGSPPRRLTPKLKRACWFTGSGGLATVPFWIFGFCLLVLTGILFMTDPAELRYGFLPFRWQPAGEGKIFSIADSGMERAPSGGFAAPGRDVIVLERILPDGQILYCRNPSWPKQGTFFEGQTVPLLQYAGDESCFRIDHPMFQNDTRITGFALLFFGGITLLGMSCPFFAEWLDQRRRTRLLATAPVVRFRVRSRKQEKSVLVPLDSGEFGPITIPFEGIPGESVHVFFDEAKPKRSFIAELLQAPLHFDAAHGTLDIESDRSFHYGIGGIVFFLCVLGLAFFRIAWVY